MSEKSAKATTGKTRKAANKKTAVPAVEMPAAPDSAKREELIAAAAYFKAEQRGFAPGSEIDDWLAAECELEAVLGLRAACVAA